MTLKFKCVSSIMQVDTPRFDPDTGKESLPTYVVECECAEDGLVGSFLLRGHGEDFFKIDTTYNFDVTEGK